MKNYVGTINGDKLNRIESLMKYFPNIPSTFPLRFPLEILHHSRNFCKTYKMCSNIPIE